MNIETIFYYFKTNKQKYIWVSPEWQFCVANDLHEFSEFVDLLLGKHRCHKPYHLWHGQDLTTVLHAVVCGPLSPDTGQFDETTLCPPRD